MGTGAGRRRRRGMGGTAVGSSTQANRASPGGLAFLLRVQGHAVAEQIRSRTTVDGRSAARRGSAEEDARRPRALWHAPVNRDAGACTRARRYPEDKGSTGAPRNHAPTCSLGSPAVRASRQGRRALPSRQPSLSQVSPILPVQVQVQPSCPKNKQGSHHLPFQNPDWKWAMNTVCFGLQSKQSGRLFQQRTEWFIHPLLPPRKVSGFICCKRIPSNRFYHFSRKK